jgi:ribosome modulation factor
MKVFPGVSMAVVLASAFLAAASASPAGFAGAGAPLPAGYAQERGWDAPPPELDEVSRRGFHDGVEGARKDYDNHRRPDVNNRDEFRHPHVPERDREAYRHGFERGYQAGVDHLYHGRP